MFDGRSIDFELVAVILEQSSHRRGLPLHIINTLYIFLWSFKRYHRCLTWKALSRDCDYTCGGNPCNVVHG